MAASKSGEENRAPKLFPTLLVLGLLLWIIATSGGRHIFISEILGKAYDSQAEHFLRGDVDVDGDAIIHEVLIVNGKSRMYFGPFPAFLRVPLNFIYPNGRGLWSRISGFCAGMVALAAFAGLTRLGLRRAQLSNAWKNLLGNACLVGFAFASPLLLLIANVSIYHEAIVWGAGWSLAALYFAVRSRDDEGRALTCSLIAFSFCAGAALLSRATFGAPFLLIAPLLAVRLLRRNPLRNLVALFLPLAAAFLFYVFLSYAKFGSLSGMPLRYSSNPAQREFATKHGLFRLERMPYSFADYFFLRRPEPERQPPFLKASRQPYNHPDLYVMPFTETYCSLLWCSSWILFGAAIGMVLLCRPAGVNAIERAIAAILFIQVIAILSFMGTAQRYTAELFPFLVFCFFMFLRSSAVAFVLTRYAMIGLVCVSVTINVLSTASWLTEVDGSVPKETRTFWSFKPKHG
ncbi:MAG TPA: hypothetical protein VH254_05655 [Candidatus Udaeobacter sp.]|jgi:hypothetical protein|nr:hypothetical protein [Candidatus Udaeobacter sp.]